MQLTPLAFAQIDFNAPIDTLPATIEVVGNVTNRFSEVLGQPGFFTVQFIIDTHDDSAGVSVGNTFGWSVAIAHSVADVSYMQIEDAAARMLPANFRELAALIEADIERSDQARQSRSTTAQPSRG